MSSQQPINPYVQNPNIRMQNGFGMNVAHNSQIADPAMAAQMIDSQAVSDAATSVATDNFIGRHVKAYDEVDRNQQMLLSVPVAVAINTAMDKYLKLYDGDYSKSLAGKIGNFGDKVSDIITENPVGQFFKNLKNKVKPYAKKYVYDKSAILRALNETPSSPEFKMALSQMNVGKDFSLQSYFNAMDGFLKPIKNYKDLDALGASKADIERIGNLIKSASDAEKQNIFYREQYKLLRPNATENEIKKFLESSKKETILKNWKVKALQFRNNAEYELYKENPEKYCKEIIEKLEKTNPKFVAKIWTSDANIFSKIKGFFVGRKLTPQQIKNIILSSLGSENKMQKTALGRQLNKIVNLTMEGITGRMFMGKVSTLIQAYFVAEAILAANKQDTTADKFRSFAERMVDFATFFVLIGPCIKLMHKVGGLKNWGMTPDEVKAYEAAKLDHNMKKAQGFFKTKKEAKEAEKLVEGMKRKAKNPISWLARKIGEFINTGDKTTTRPYSRFTHKNVNMNIMDIGKTGVGQYIKNIPHRAWDVMCNPKYWFKRMAGWPIRFVIPMMLLSIPNKYLTKLCHSVFGKPKYSIVDEDKIKEQEEQAKQMQEAIQKQQELEKLQAQNGETNLIKQYENALQQQTNAAATTAAAANIQNPELQNNNQTNKQISESNLINNTVTSTDKINPNEELEPIRTYIPSSEGMVVQNSEDATAANQAIANADKTEAEIQSILKGITG